MHPQIAFFTTGAWPGHEPVYRGHDGMKRYWDTFHASWEFVEAETTRAEDLGDRVLALLIFRGKGRASGVEVQMNIGTVFTFADGLMIECRAYPGWDQALKAVGLEE